MIKDILVNLTVDKARDVAGDFAISVASLFDAHLSATAVACKLPRAPHPTIAACPFSSRSCPCSPIS